MVMVRSPLVIANQKQHHSKKTFQNEYRTILKKCKSHTMNDMYGINMIYGITQDRAMPYPMDVTPLQGCNIYTYI
jgi:hypothetical protein